MNTIFLSVLELTEVMLEYCKNAEWEALAKAEEERKVLMEKIPKNIQSNHQEYIEITQKTLDLNNKIIELTENNKQENQKELLALNRSMKKTSLYQQ